MNMVKSRKRALYLGVGQEAPLHRTSFHIQYQEYLKCVHDDDSMSSFVIIYDAMIL